MQVQLSREQEAFLKQAIANGRFRDEQEAVRDALALLEEREQERFEILAAVDAAEASLARGEGSPITEQSVKDLASAVKARGRARLEAEPAIR